MSSARMKMRFGGRSAARIAEDAASVNRNSRRFKMAGLPGCEQMSITRAHSGRADKSQALTIVASSATRGVFQIVVTPPRFDSKLYLMTSMQKIDRRSFLALLAAAAHAKTPIHIGCQTRSYGLPPEKMEEILPPNQGQAAA